MGKPLSKKVVAAVLKRDGGLCVIQLDGCLRDANVADHRRNRGSGGARSLDGKSNLIAACGLCNGAKEDTKGELRDLLIARGVIIESGRTHEHEAQKARETPVWYPDGRVWRLDDHGGKTEVK
ncbi:hypothetical protein G7068_11875 [Leucobacter viscericola]|uniref:HNH endonuclease n=1 Tax=Leucobacter viscericola TaxID=2714935 RepID=A0A6G7XHF0_9MICO|nr:hypothetical protein [Leucobacter viscericola]QIK63807.1 hypothetical protein G7068_11875 [Leucobacter viscericola]